MTDITTLVTQDEILNFFASKGLLGDYVRDEEIRRKFKALTSAGMLGKDAMNRLADEYPLSVDAIDYILYTKKKYDVKIIGNHTNRVIIITQVEKNASN